MKKVLRLVSVQLWGVVGDMLAVGSNNKKKRKSIYAGIVAFVLIMSSISFIYSFAIGQVLLMFGSIDLLPAMMMAVTSLIVLFTTVFKVKGTIFGFRDYDMVMSLPVSTGGIVASRLILLYCINLMFVLICMLPMVIAYGILAKPEVLFYIISFLVVWFIPLVPIVVASIIGTLITYISSKFRHSNLVTILISITAVVLLIGSSLMFKGTEVELVNISRAMTEQVNSSYPLAGMYTNSVVEYDLAALFSFLWISATAFLIYSFIIGKVFKKINTLLMTGRFRVNFKLAELKTTSPFKALYHKELKRFFSSTIYVLNVGIGIIMLTVGSIALLFLDLDKIMGNAQAVLMLKNYSPLFLMFCISMCSSTMVSISMEGRNLWIIKALPVKPSMIFNAKMAVNLTIIAPALLNVILLSIAFQFNILQGVLILLLTIAFSLFVTVFGLFVNLKLPNFTWTNETAAVKQSASTMVVIFSGMAVVGLQFLLLILLPSFELAYLAAGVLLILVDVLLYRSVMSSGAKRFQTL